MSRLQFWALPAWEQADHVADWEMERDRCPQCKRPAGECDDADVDWFPQRDVCYPTMALAAADAKYDELHEKRPYHNGTFESWAEKRSASHPFHFRDGVGIWVSRDDLTPEDLFLDRPSPAREQLVGEPSQAEDRDASADGEKGRT